ncbi:MAG TPA: ATP-binding cassette domain-containing protein, partial [Phenylobacterium sp.]|nr:ATP-binding cassette domain-containing protein [Phenylobacterium sp.]
AAPASPWAGLALLAGLGAQIIIGRCLSERLTRQPGRDQLAAGGRLKDGLGAYLMAAAELRAFDLTPRAIDALMVHDAALGRAALQRNSAESILGLVQSGLVALTLIAVAALSSHAPLPFAALAVLAALAGMEGVNGLLRAAQQQGAYDAAVARLDAVIWDAAAPAPAPPATSTIEIDAHLLPAGSRVAITGPSGCGKTSILEALLGLREASPGRFRIGSRPLESAPAGWARTLFTYAPQDARLLTGTVAENLRLAAPEANETALWEALADAQLETRVRRLPRGLETWIGDGGEALSGGERRRLALARAYLRPAAWMLLDEPSEGLDRDTESALVEALDRRLRRTGQGLILVSHRPHPLSICTRSLAMGEGTEGTILGS